MEYLLQIGGETRHVRKLSKSCFGYGDAAEVRDTDQRMGSHQLKKKN